MCQNYRAGLDSPGAFKLQCIRPYFTVDGGLQDHFRSIVKPAYTNVYRERGGVLGVVEFDTREDLERAIRKLDDTEFKNPFDRAFIRVIDESDDRGGRSRSRSPRGGRSGFSRFVMRM